MTDACLELQKNKGKVKPCSSSSSSSSAITAATAADSAVSTKKRRGDAPKGKKGTGNLLQHTSTFH
jgi:hypothetical protein